MRLSPAVHWFDTAQGTTVDPRLLELLAGIEARGSLRKACDAIGIPYRTAWGLLQAMERACGGPLVRLHRGRGARLAEDGAALLRADRNARDRLAEAFESMVLEIGPARTRGRGSVTLLRLAASHDLALAQLQDALPAALGAQIATEFCGSLDALRHFRAGQVDIAG
ncbi:MAG TPA: hypothetical protein VLT59_05875, partial [Steroidobacteraceae bacterium]|nr:hypothetical protein [Steroidobacteraceae bacterium]